MATRCDLSPLMDAISDTMHELNQKRRYWTPADWQTHSALKDCLIALYQADEAYDREREAEQLFGKPLG